MIQAYKITKEILEKFCDSYDGKGFIPSLDTNGNTVVPITYINDDKFNLSADLTACEIIECEVI